jgi:hypothetical protein
MSANLRQPFARVQVWQRKRTDRQVLLGAVQEVASAIFPSYEPFDLPDPAATSGVETYDTVVEVLTQFARGAHDRADRSVTDICFDRCLWAVNRLVLGVANATKDPDLHAYAVEELDPFALVASRPWDGDFDVRAFLFAINPDRIPFPRRPLTDEEYDRTRVSMAAEAQGQPFLEYARLMRAARRAARIGDHAHAVILACVSGEVLLNLVLRAILVETGRQSEIAAMFSDERGLFAARLRRNYGPLLGGQWHADRPLTPVGRWVAATQSVRNRVVHAGHEPTPFESAEAARGAEGLEAFVFQRLAERRYRYPKTVLSVLAEPGLRQQLRIVAWQRP